MKPQNGGDKDQPVVEPDDGNMESPPDAGVGKPSADGPSSNREAPPGWTKEEMDNAPPIPLPEIDDDADSGEEVN